MKKTADIDFCRSAHTDTGPSREVSQNRAPWEGSEREPIMANTYGNAIINPLLYMQNLEAILNKRMTV